jgi:hypothetical protein
VPSPRENRARCTPVTADPASSALDRFSSRRLLLESTGAVWGPSKRLCTTCRHRTRNPLLLLPGVRHFRILGNRQNSRRLRYRCRLLCRPRVPATLSLGVGREPASVGGVASGYRSPSERGWRRWASYGVKSAAPAIAGPTSTTDGGWGSRQVDHGKRGRHPAGLSLPLTRACGDRRRGADPLMQVKAAGQRTSYKEQPARRRAKRQP